MKNANQLLKILSIGLNMLNYSSKEKVVTKYSVSSSSPKNCPIPSTEK